MRKPKLKLCRQFLKRERGRSNHVTQGIYEQIGSLAAIESKLHLFEIGR